MPTATGGVNGLNHPRPLRAGAGQSNVPAEVTGWPCAYPINNNESPYTGLGEHGTHSFDEQFLHLRAHVSSCGGRHRRDRRFDISFVALEALLRWEHPQRGMISPAEFIPIAEETGLIVPIGAQVLTEACRHAARWGRLNEGGPCLGLSVNLSGRQLGRADLVPTMERIVSDAGLDSFRVRLGVEVTETVVMQDPIGAARTLQALRELGVHLSIDDFGTGYSSLAYLKRFPVDTIKIDRAFVTLLADDHVDRAIVNSVVQLAGALNMRVVAEGVETEEQAEALRTLGVHRMQGFLFARPQPAPAIDAMLEGGLPQRGRSKR